MTKLDIRCIVKRHNFSISGIICLLTTDISKLVIYLVILPKAASCHTVVDSRW